MKPRREGEGLLVPLVCPSCGGEVDAGSGDRIGTCDPCALAYFLGARLEPFPLRFVRPPPGSGDGFSHLPFWRIRAVWSVLAEPKRARLYAGLGNAGDLFFPAFWRPRMTYFDDVTWRYFRLQEPLPAERGEGRLRGGVRPPAVVREMGRLAVLSYMDRIADIEGVEVRFEVVSQDFVGIPFLRVGAGWTDAVCGLKFPPSLFPD